MSGSNEQQPQPPPDLNAAIQALIQQHIAAASGQGNQVQLPTLPAPQAQSQYSNDPDKGPDLLARIGLAIGGGSLPGAPAELRQQMGKQALLNFGIGLLGAGRFSTPGEALAGGLRGAQSGLLGSEAAQAGQQEYALNAQTELAKLGAEQQKNRVAALTALVPLMQMQGRLGLPPLYGGGGPGGAGPGGGDTAFTGDPDKDLPMIAQRESGGDPTALNYVAKADPTAYARGATASGKYQLVNSTWLTAAKAAGIDTDKYPTARDAPEALQDQAARKLYAMQGTAPWDASKFGANWVKQQDGTYQLVKGAQPPASGPGSAVGPYKVASRENVPPPSGTATAALPTPPVPPEGATPSPVPVGNLGLVRSGPPGNTTVGTPGSFQTAMAAPPGVVTTPPAPAPAPTPTTNPPAVVAPQPATQADQPPAQPPAVDLKSRPDTELNAEQFIQKHWVPLTPDQVKTYAPGPDGQVAAAAADQVQRAKQQVTAAETQLNQIRGGILPGDVNKAQGQVNDANKELDAAENNYNTTVRSLQSDGAKNLLAADDQQRQQLRADYKTSVLDPRNKAAELTQQNQLAIALEKAKTQSASEGKVMDSLNETQESARTALDQLDLAGSLSQASGSPGFWQMVQQSHPDMVRWLGAAGALPEETVKQLGTTGAMDAAFNKLISMARTGSGFQRMTNLDVQILSSQAPEGTSPEAWRDAKMAYLRTYMQRQSQYVDLVHSYAARPNTSIYDAQRLAKADMEKSGVVPTFDPTQFQDIPGGQSAADQRKAYALSHFPPNTFYRLPDGTMRIWAPNAPRQQQQQPRPLESSLVPSQ